jgi:hypothetical protein
MLKSRTLLMAKIEGTYGTDSVPVKATNAILAGRPEITVIAKRMDRLYAVPWMGKGAPLNIGEGIQIKFDVELRGKGGLATVPPEFGCLLQSCNFTETIGETNVVYALNSLFSADEDALSCTIYAYQHSFLHKVTGCRGDVSIDLTAGEFGKLSFVMTGIYGGPIDDTIPADPTFNTTVPPRFIAASFTVASYSAIIKQLKLSLGNSVIPRSSANAATGILEWMVADRAPKGGIDPEAVAIATKDFWSMWEDSTPVAIAAMCGSATGNKCHVECAGAVAETPKYGDRSNILTHGFDFTLHPQTGNDEMKLTFS